MNTSIHWHDWSDETLKKAQDENKPIFLSVGYFTCFWCHVMEEQVYSDPLLARTLNDGFIAIKVDRDERPDIDEIYMHARELITKHSGWPNHVFLTPEGKPFLATGVMLNKPDRPTLHGMVSKVLSQWQENETAIRNAASQIADIVKTELSRGVVEGMKPAELSAAYAFYDYLKKHYDTDHGGFYADPKFPHENYLLFLLSYYRHQKDDEALDMAAQSLKKMAAGSLNDPIGGGFHRYTNDREWRAPHFEKMLYTQALSARCYAELYEQTRLPYHEDLASQTLDFVLRELRSKDGAFYSALDAETDGIEGAYYVWQEEELQNLLTPQQQELFAKCYGLTDMAPQPGHPLPNGSVIHARQHLMALANEKRKSYEQLRNELNPIFELLLTERNKRKRPDTDEKIISGWNGLMVDSLARAGRILDRADYTEAAITTANYIWNHLRIDGKYLARCQKGTEILGHAHLRDYAYVEAGMLSLFDTTGDRQWLERSEELHKQTASLFWDEEGGGYYVTDGSENLLVRVHRGSDAGLPAASGVMMHNLVRLYQHTKKDDWLTRARRISRVYQQQLEQTPEDYSTMLQALLSLAEV